MAAVTQLLNIILDSLMKLILKIEGFGVTLDQSFRAVGCPLLTWGAMKARNPWGVNVMAAVTQLLIIILGSLMKLILRDEGFGITLDLSFRAVGCPLITWGQ
jgi:hypothetical protein